MAECEGKQRRIGRQWQARLVAEWGSVLPFGTGQTMQTIGQLLPVVLLVAGAMTERNDLAWSEMSAVDGWLPLLLVSRMHLEGQGTEKFYRNCRNDWIN